ncbi:hypothetical protein ECG_08272 [Echinococcus granulosus]|nr:hypothetical protein ECG_08272 [Echinococcus granulosus]
MTTATHRVMQCSGSELQHYPKMRKIPPFRLLHQASLRPLLARRESPSRVVDPQPLPRRLEVKGAPSRVLDLPSLR